MDAVDDLSDAIDTTRNLLIPVRAWLWVKLAVVVFFLGGGGAGANFSSGDPTMFTGDAGPTDFDDITVAEITEMVTTELLVLIAIVAIVVFLIWLFFAVLAAVMEFVFIESLRSMEVSIISYGMDNFGRALRLFVFRALVGLVAALIVLVPLGAIVYTASSLEAILGSLVLIILLALAVGLAHSIVMRFTSEFVAPIMLLESRGVLGGWSRFWGTFKANWTEYVVYLLLVWILQLVIGIGVGILMLIVGLIVAIPFLILIFALLTLGDIGILLAVIVGVVGAVLLLLVSALISMPVRTYFQYYALLLLGDTNDDLDLIPDQREAVRSDGGRPEPDRSDERRDDPDRDTENDWDSRADETDDEWDSTPSWDDDGDSESGSDWDEPDDDDRDDDRGW
ncbi:DUF7544 domain-containing protein [Natrarchaeobius chitinivorans]|uniref:Glycerophosphoryl diester phosphodiesterase membrane domain-containing protein n=1 Tax=Natrarchaeobius chitinivorans TaxID=1679083 RepID=A0A3N6PCR6_NATCH|nr:hypothetical protein [Natrarchaeobius chitinivorans]RQG97319.1 hypothetical protein EA473_04455 [Natrarchaeobius chitinivorans]